MFERVNDEQRPKSEGYTRPMFDLSFLEDDLESSTESLLIDAENFGSKHLFEDILEAREKQI